MTLATHSLPPGGKGAPPWAIAMLFPNQGHWSEGEYLDLSERTNRLIEMDEGCVEVLDLPNLKHQEIVSFLNRSFEDFVRPNKLGKVIFAAYPLRLRDDRFREPDVLFVLTEHLAWFGGKFATGADLVVEVVSEDRARDFHKKRSEYEEAGIPEYWIVDPRERQITVLGLVNGVYEVVGDYSGEGRAESKILPGFTVELSMVFSEF